MASRLPPELLSAEERARREAELERTISREWLHFALVEAAALWLPSASVLLLYAMTDVVSVASLALASAAAVGASSALVLYWLTVRVRPLQRELETLRRFREASVGA